MRSGEVSEHGKNSSGLDAAAEAAANREGERHAVGARAHARDRLRCRARKIAPRRIACGDSVNLLPPDTERFGGAEVK
jgi:hypothetical protein